MKIFLIYNIRNNSNKYMESNINLIIEDESLILFHSYKDVQDIKDQLPYKIENKISQNIKKIY